MNSVPCLNCVLNSDRIQVVSPGIEQQGLGGRGDKAGISNSSL